MRRRSLLKGAGVVTVLVAGGGVWQAWEQGVFSAGEGPAFQPWKDWKNAGSGPLALVSAGILAASPHNTQPWLFKAGASRIEIYADIGRNTGALDPYLREMHISLGCALENMMLTAAALGYDATPTLLPGKLAPAPAEAQPQLAASIDLAPGAPQPSRLYDAIPHRHTNRNPYELRPLPEDFLRELGRVTDGEPQVKLFLFSGNEERQRIVELISEANDTVYADPEVERGTQRWVHRDWNEVQRRRDGLIIDEFGQTPLVTALDKMLPPPWVGFGFRHHLLRPTRYIDVLHATPAFGVIAVPDHFDREQSLRAGRIWQRTHLLATAHGLAGRPLSEVVELVDHQRLRGEEPKAAAALAQLLGDPAWQATFMFRLGYPLRQVPPSPRRAVGDVLI